MVSCPSDPSVPSGLRVQPGPAGEPGQGREAPRAADRSVLTLHSSRPPRAAPLAAASHWPLLGGVGQWAAAAAGRWKRAAATVNRRRRGWGGWLLVLAGRPWEPGQWGRAARPAHPAASDRSA